MYKSYKLGDSAFQLSTLGIVTGSIENDCDVVDRLT